MSVLRHVCAVAASAAFFVGVAAAGHAEGPAVSALNGKISGEGGSINSNGNQSAIGVVEGSVTTPLGHSFGFQADLAGGIAYGSFLGGGALHGFWRDPSIGLFGPIAAMGGARGSRIGLYGAEGEWYMDKVTLGLTGGYQDAVNNGIGQAPSGGFGTARLTVYPIDNLAMAIEGRNMAGLYSGRGIVEYQPDFMTTRNMSFFFDGESSGSAFYRVTGGVRFYFGGDKTLIRRHREDDPPQIPLGTITPPSIGGPPTPAPTPVVNTPHPI